MKAEKVKEAIVQIKEQVPQNKRLTQFAEECCEGAQAALKLVRAYDGEPQLKTSECRIHLLEEIADILICMDVICNDLDSACLKEIYSEKLYRWKERLDGTKSR